LRPTKPTPSANDSQVRVVPLNTTEATADQIASAPVTASSRRWTRPRARSSWTRAMSASAPRLTPNVTHPVTWAVNAWLATTTPAPAMASATLPDEACAHSFFLLPEAKGQCQRNVRCACNRWASRQPAIPASL
jgi:hypothetical protein